MGWSSVERFLFTTEKDQPERVMKLLSAEQHGTKLRSCLGSSLLHICSLQNRPLTMGMLINMGCNVNAKNDYEETPLHWASKSGFPSICALLIANGARVNIEDSDGNTPLHWACEHDQISVVNLLLGAKASVQIDNFEGETPLQIAIKNGYTTITKRLLTSPNIDLDYVNEISGESNLDCASYSENKDIIQLLQDTLTANTNTNSILAAR